MEKDRQLEKIMIKEKGGRETRSTIYKVKGQEKKK